MRPWREKSLELTLGTNSAPMSIAKSMLKEVQKYQKPKLIVIDLNGILYNDEHESKEGALRVWIDNMKWSKNKLDAIHELVLENERLYYYIPLLKYHSNLYKLPINLYFAYRNIKSKFYLEYLSVKGMTAEATIEPQDDSHDVISRNK